MEDARFDGPPAHRLEVDAAAVVGDRDAHVVALAARLDDEPARRGLAGLAPLLGRLDAVVHRVADQVGERVGEAVEDRPVQLELGSAQLDFDVLAEAGGQLPRGARQRVDDAQQRRGPQAERTPLQVADHALHAIEAAPEVRRPCAAPAGARAELRRGEDDLADGGQQPVQRLGAHAHGGRRRGRAHLRGGRRARRRCARQAFFSPPPAGAAEDASWANSASSGGGLSPLARIAATIRSRPSSPRNSSESSPDPATRPLLRTACKYLHARARADWGLTEALSADDLIAEKFQGIRPAFGYPACPDHSLKSRLFDLLGARAIGMALTESFAMTPPASVSGLYFWHPQARYFHIQRVNADQAADYARRLGVSTEESEKWLRPVLAYDQTPVVRR